MQCSVCDHPVYRDGLCQGCYDDLASGGDEAMRVAEMFQLRLAERDARIAELEAALRIAESNFENLCYDLEHDGFDANNAV